MFILFFSLDLKDSRVELLLLGSAHNISILLNYGSYFKF